MNEDNTKIINNYVEEELDIVDMEFISPMMNVDELTEKRIKKIEKIIRNSYEYKNYINYIKNELDITQCALLDGIDVKEIKGVGIELHHTPLNLYEITEIVAKFIFDNTSLGGSVSNFDIAKLVMKEHYLGTIGLVPLTKTMHEAAHNFSIVIPASKIYGDYAKFIDTYRSQMSMEQITGINEKIRFADTTYGQDKNKKITEVKVSLIKQDETVDEDISELNLKNI